MQKAFIFDLDGVLINSEVIWEQHKKKLYAELLGDDVSQKLGSTLGVNMDTIYERAVANGAVVSKQKLLDAFFDIAKTVYKEAPLTNNLDELDEYLFANKFNVGIVSASPSEWINAVLERLSFKSHIRTIISLYETQHLRHKPHPDGYVQAMEELEATPSTTAILEDSNGGIESAKASGAFTIGFQENLVEGYEQSGADAYAKDVSDVIKLLQEFHKG